MSKKKTTSQEIVEQATRRCFIPGQKNKATSRSLCHYYKQTPSAIDEDVGVKIRGQEGVFSPVRLQFRGRCDITLCVHDMHTKSES